MRTSVFGLNDDMVSPAVTERPSWKPFEEYDGKPLKQVGLVEVIEFPHGAIQLVEIRAGGSFAMHSSPDVAFCQIVRGRGKLGLPDGTEIDYDGPELFVFLPDTLHDWHDIEEDTLLSVCLVSQER
jgi:quercetin dioxygenase-like cupin family protein